MAQQAAAASFPEMAQLVGAPTAAAFQANAGLAAAMVQPGAPVMAQPFATMQPTAAVRARRLAIRQHFLDFS